MGCLGDTCPEMPTRVALFDIPQRRFTTLTHLGPSDKATSRFLRLLRNEPASSPGFLWQERDRRGVGTKFKSVRNPLRTLRLSST